MIVYIINGKTTSVQDAVDYVCDENKTAKKFDEIRSTYQNSPDIQEDMTLEEYYISCEDNFNRALNYIANEDKIGGYISGYLCDPELADEQFRETKRINLERVGKQLKDDMGNYYYHIIQSFPEGLEISDEEVHQCGVELVERLGLYQAVVASHIHPQMDEEGEVHGKCKHNHIIMNSHMYHEFVDPHRPNKMKYNDSKETYAQLQMINDQIAIEHGLPIIMEQDNDRAYSWHESNEINKGKSWKQRVRIDINNAMKVSTDHQSFVKTMEAAGYSLRTGNSKTHGKYIAYTCPDGNHRVRDYTLGRGYTTPDLEAYWDIKKGINEDVSFNKETAENKIENLLANTTEPLFIKFDNKISDRRKKEMRDRNLNIKSTYTNFLPLTSGRKNSSKAELSYFDPISTYEIVNRKQQTLAEVSGAEILEYFNRLYDLERAKEREEEERRKREQEAYYSNPYFIRSATGSPYKVRLWDENGRKRSTIELLIILAIVTIHNENGKWEALTNNPSQTQETLKHPIYAKRDWKIQNMVDTIRVAREEKIDNLKQLETRLDLVGKDISKAKAELRRLTATKNQMEVLHEAIEGYLEVKDICERLQEMPDSPQKTELQVKHAEEIEEYKRHKSLMYRYKISTQEDIADFRERYQQIEKKLPFVEEQLAENKEVYRRLSKLKYNLQLAQNRQYCYGPEYQDIEPEQDRDNNKEQDERSNSNQAKG